MAREEDVQGLFFGFRRTAVSPDENFTGIEKAK
jgi:hypothetical protein